MKPSTSFGHGVQGRRGFTLVEMLTVIAVITILAGFILGSLAKSKREARETECMNSMRNLALAAIMYRDDFSILPVPDPPWLSTMYGRSGATSKKVYVCTMDPYNGKDTLPDGSQYNPRYMYIKLDPTAFPYQETADTISNPYASWTGRPTDLPGCSYLYEFNGAPYRQYVVGGACPSWAHDLDGDGKCSWAEAKLGQMAGGDGYSCSPFDGTCPPANWKPYSVGDFVMIRCYWHMQNKNGRKEVMNIAYDSRAFKSGVIWQTTWTAD